MDVQAWDAVFVRARRRDVHPALADVAGWGGWWPGMVTRPAGASVVVSLRPPGLARRRQRFAVRVVKNRPGLGVDLRYDGELTGGAEFYYLDEPTGVTVHYIVRARVSAHRWRATLRDHRAGVRCALDTLKDRYEGGRLPGAEPDPGLLADQRAAIAQFRAGVEAWERKLAAERAAAEAGVARDG